MTPICLSVFHHYNKISSMINLQRRTLCFGSWFLPFHRCYCFLACGKPVHDGGNTWRNKLLTPWWSRSRNKRVECPLSSKGTLRHVQKTSYKSPRLKGFVSSQLWHGLKRKAITNTWACEDIQNPTTASVKHFNLGL